MTRKTADERYADATPTVQWPPTTPGDILDTISAIAHPTRRKLLDALKLGPASVGILAERTGVAVGNVSHHLRVLARTGFVELAPDLAKDTRETWWRAISRTFSWSSDDFLKGTVGRRVADIAADINLADQEEELRVAMRSDADVTVSSSLDLATPSELADLERRLAETITTWREGLADDVTGRVPVRIITRTYPLVTTPPTP